MSSLAGADKKQGCPACLSLPTPVASLLVSIPLMALRLPPLYCFFLTTLDYSLLSQYRCVLMDKMSTVSQHLSQDAQIPAFVIKI